MERYCTALGTKTVLLCILYICVVPGKVPWPVTEFHEQSQCCAWSLLIEKDFPIKMVFAASKVLDIPDMGDFLKS